MKVKDNRAKDNPNPGKESRVKVRDNRAKDSPNPDKGNQGKDSPLNPVKLHLPDKVRPFLHPVRLPLPIRKPPKRWLKLSTPSIKR